MRKKFESGDLISLWRPEATMTKFDGGQVVIVGGSSLFHGAPVLALKAASRLVDMVYFASGEENRDIAEKIKTSLSAFIWIPRDELDEYIKKSDVVLIGPGLMRYVSEKGGHNGQVCDGEGRETKALTERLVSEFPLKKWALDGGSLQVMDDGLIPLGAVVTPNTKEYEMLFRERINWRDFDGVVEKVERQAVKHGCVIALKGVVSVVSDGKSTYLVEGGSPGLSKGGTGDVVAGLTAGLLVKNPPVLAAAAANFLVKKTAEELDSERGEMFNADDLVERVPVVYKRSLMETS